MNISIEFHIFFLSKPKNRAQTGIEPLKGPRPPKKESPIKPQNSNLIVSPGYKKTQVALPPFVINSKSSKYILKWVK